MGTRAVCFVVAEPQTSPGPDTAPESNAHVQKDQTKLQTQKSSRLEWGIVAGYTPETETEVLN